MAHGVDDFQSFQAFLDSQQYTLEGIRRYEFIFGKTYVSTGGQRTTEEFVKELKLQNGDKVLDVGCGIGGSAFHMARLYNARVHGVDLSTNMVSLAVENQREMEESVRENVSFEVSDVTKQKFEPGSFDVIYSRDCILHIQQKEELFSNFFNWLKPGGKLMISDYCKSDKERHSEDFLAYVAQRRYHLLTVKQYGNILQKVGFENVVADDRTEQFIDILQVELDRFNEQRVEFLNHFDENEFDYIVSGWEAKVVRCSSGDQAWGLFTATKPQLSTDLLL